MMNGPEKSDPCHSSWEPDEQSRVDPSGAKGRDQGECGPIKHAPDSEHTTPPQAGRCVRTLPRVRAMLMRCLRQ